MTTLYQWFFVLFVAVTLTAVPTTSGEEGVEGAESRAASRVGPDTSQQQKALVVPSHLESVVGVWSKPFELEFIPKHEVTIRLTSTGGGDIAFSPSELVFDGTEPFQKSFRIKGTKTGYFHIHYEFQSNHPFPFDGMKQSLIYVADKAQISVIQPQDSTLTVGCTSEAHKISLTRQANVKVVPKADGIVFEPREILFSRQGPRVKDFRARVLDNAGSNLHNQNGEEHAAHEPKFSVLVSLELRCLGEDEDDFDCDRDGIYEPADFRWEVMSVNSLEVKDKVVATNKEVFDLPISFRFPQECRIEVFSNGLMLSKSFLQLSREDTSVTNYIKVMGRREKNQQRSCPPTSPCTYMVQYVVKDIHGRLATNFGLPAPTYVTTVYIVDKIKINLPGNETVAFVGQTITLHLSWPENHLQLQEENLTDDVLFEVHIEGDGGSDVVTIEPSVVQFKNQKDRLEEYPFNVTLHSEGEHTISFRLAGPRSTLVQLVENSISLTSYESFYEDSFSFEEKYGIGGLDSQLNEIMRRALISRVVSAEAIDALGVSHVKGILLHGPPGCGKTMVARQIGSMLQTHPPKVVNGPEIISKYLGESENKIRSLFADAEADQGDRRRKLHLIVFDEIDALVRPRGRGQGEAADQVYDGITNQLLSKMDGIDKLDNCLVVGTTNRKDLIDPALLRPGRFDVILEINLPDKEGRLQIFRIHTKKLYQSGLMAEDVDLDKLAKLTKTFTGAEIEAVVKAASSLAMEDMFKVTNSANIRPNQFSVKMAHFSAALKDIEPANVDSHEVLDNLDDYGRLLVYNKPVESAIKKFTNAVNYVYDQEEGEGKRVISILVHGEAGTGKTGFVANIMKGYNFERLKIISAESLIMESRSSMERKIQIIHDAFKGVSSSKHLCSALILDDLDGILEHVDTQAGQYYVNSPMLSQLRILMRKPSQGSFVLVATASSSSIMKFNQIAETFDVVIELPKVESVAETSKILQDINTNDDASVKEENIIPLIEEHLPMSIKKLLKFIDLAHTNADLIPDPPLAKTAGGEAADQDPYDGPDMIDMSVNNKTSIKIFLM